MDTRLAACCGLILALAACGQPSGDSSVPPDNARTGNTAGFAWAILPTEAGPAFAGDPNGYWLPDAMVVRGALEGVQAYLVEQSKLVFPEEERDTEIWHEMVRGVLGQLALYRCQVVGYTEEGRRRIYLNFAHQDSFETHPDDEPEDAEDWTKTPHIVFDGGDWYWQAFYDPQAKAFTWLGINGEA